MLRAALTCSVFLLPLAARAGDSEPRNLLGSTGLIDMPSARMAPDGELSIGGSFLENNQHYNLGFQVLPWLEGTFRYSGLQNFDLGRSINLATVYFDRSFAMKARLFNETEYTPAVALGINDLIGTGAYSGEYLVASKQFGAVDATLGIGWGRMGSTGLFKNPLTLLSSSFDNRALTGTPGAADYNIFFRGPKAGLFGGVVWHTPIDGLSLIAEYSSDRYELENLQGNFRPRTQINAGVSYKVMDGTTLGLDWLYGRSIGGSLTFALDPAIPQFPVKASPAPPTFEPRTAEEQQKAIATLLNHSTPTRHAGDASRSARNMFVDGLIADGGDFRDIRLKGATLELVSTQPRETLQHCSNYANSARLYANSIRSIALYGSSPDRPIRCAVPAAETLQLDLPAPESAFRFYNPELLPASATIIDASAPAAKMDAAKAAKAIRADAARQNIDIQALSIGESELVVYYGNNRYFSEAAALGRLVRVLMADAPPTVEKFRLIATVAAVPQREFDVLRSPMERNLGQGGGTAELGDALTSIPAPMRNPPLTRSIHPSFDWAIYPTLHESVFDPKQPLGIELAMAAEGTVTLAQGLTATGEVEANIYNNFNTDRPSDSLLPHVRSDVVQYFNRGKNGIGDLEVDYNFRLSPNVSAIARAGYLESMFAGAGGEVLWRPEGARWALGADLYEVWQRDFDRLFGLQVYHALTGHVALYYESPWYNLDFAVRAGQYLAKDRGITFEITRRFATGVEIGAFATFTNVSATQFGEGSFDKGIIIRIPLGWIAPIESQKQIGMDLRPVQRDGGQRLGGDSILYEQTRRTSVGEMERNMDDFLKPD